VQNREIPRSEWGSFLRGFSQGHEDWLVTLRIANPDLGSVVQARDLPLEGIVLVRLSDEGAEEGIEIESRDGIRTTAEFCSAPPAEAVNGILHP
jgi:hypothetical protein